MSTIATALRSARLARGISQGRLAELAGLHRTNIAHLEGARSRDPSLSMVRRLVAVLGDELLSSLFPQLATRPSASPGAAPLDPATRPGRFAVGDLVPGVAPRRVTASESTPKGRRYAWTCAACAAPGAGLAFALARAASRPCRACRLPSNG